MNIYTHVYYCFVTTYNEKKLIWFIDPVYLGIDYSILNIYMHDFEDTDFQIILKPVFTLKEIVREELFFNLNTF